MNTLAILLPSPSRTAPARSSPEIYTWTAADPNTDAKSGVHSAPLDLLPRTRSAILVVPPQRLSWHRINVPKVAPSRLRQALWGVLEDVLLDPEETLHFALSPGARAGSEAWVAVCDKAWLARQIDLFEQAGYALLGVVPLVAPAPAHGHQDAAAGADAAAALPSARSLWVQQADEVPFAHCSDGEGTLSLRLEEAPNAWKTGIHDGETVFSAEPAAAAAAEAWAGKPPQLRTLAEQMRLTAASGWNLAQFDLAPRRNAALMARWLRGLQALAQAPEWRATRYGLAAALVVQIVGMNAWAWHAKHRLAQSQQAAIAELRQVFPATGLVVDAPAQMEQGLVQLRQAAGTPAAKDLGPMLQALAGAWPAGVRIDALDYEAGALDVTSGVSEQQQIELVAKLARAGYAVRVDAGLQGTKLTLSPAAAPAGNPT
ncbi:MAG: type II secretion system protein GspL [Pseudoxanthomonas sp.]